MQLQANLDLIEVPQGDLWEFAKVVPRNAHIAIHYNFKDDSRFATDWELQEFELLAQWGDGDGLVSKSATIDLTDGTNLIDAIHALVDATPEDAIFEPIVAAYDHTAQMPLERLSPKRCFLVAFWEQDPTIPLMEL